LLLFCTYSFLYFDSKGLVKYKFMLFYNFLYDFLCICKKKLAYVCITNTDNNVSTIDRAALGIPWFSLNKYQEKKNVNVFVRAVSHI